MHKSDYMAIKPTWLIAVGKLKILNLDCIAPSRHCLMGGCGKWGQEEYVQEGFTEIKDLVSDENKLVQTKQANR